MNANSGDTEHERTFDWAAIHQRIAAASATLASTGEADPEVVERIWAQRAAQLAIPLTEQEVGEQVELALVQLGQEIYGIDVRHILAIRPAEQIRRVPRTPQWASGVVNLSGRILSVLDLRSFFGLALAEPGDTENHLTPFPDLVVVEVPTMEAALLVEDVLAIETFTVGRIQDVTETIRGIRPEYVQGVLDWGESSPRMVVVLDLPTLLTDERLIIREEAS